MSREPIGRAGPVARRLALTCQERGREDLLIAIADGGRTITRVQVFRPPPDPQEGTKRGGKDPCGHYILLLFLSKSLSV